MSERRGLMSVGASEEVTPTGDWRYMTSFMSNLQMSITRLPESERFLPENLKLSFKAKNSGWGFSGEWADRGLRTVDIYDTGATATDISSLFNQHYGLHTITFHDSIVVSNIRSFAAYTSVEHIYGAIDASGCPSAWSLEGFCQLPRSGGLRDVEFVQDSIKYSFNLNVHRYLTDASLVSIVNGLSSSASGQKLTLHADSLARCNAIKGSDINGTFVEDSDGAMTLMDFGTSVKGWTIA